MTRSLLRFAVCVALISAPAFAATVAVGSGMPLLTTFPNISVAISSSRRKRRAGAAVITVPAGGLVQNTTSLATGNPIAAQIVFDGATSANLSYLVVDGSNNNIQTCGLNLIGIYDRNSSGTITKNSLLNQTLPSGFTGCPSGLGIFVQSGDAGTSKSPSPGTSRAQMSPSRATP